ncbi:MAG: hypothetical protein N2512_00205 [Armatimonadetes bacterium]|nr:hypothetical protein [Armatimonadota bacterium]
MRAAIRVFLASWLFAAEASLLHAQFPLKDEHTIALYDFRTGTDEALVDQCGGGDLRLGMDDPPPMQKDWGLIFDGKTMYLTSLPPLSSPVTIEALVFLDGPSPGGVHGIFEQFEYLQAGCRLGLVGQEDCRVEFQISDPAGHRMVSLTGRTPVRIGEWTHIAATYDGQTMCVYVNGEEDGAMEWAGGIAPGPSGMMIGYLSGPDYFLNGALGFLRISKVARQFFPHASDAERQPARRNLEVEVSYPPRRAHFFAADQPFDISCRIVNRTARPMKCRLHLAMELHGAGTTTSPEAQVTVPARGEATTALPVKLGVRGLYMPTLSVEAQGEEIFRRRLPCFAIIEPLPPLQQIPGASHFGGQPTYYMPGSELIGMKWNRLWDYPTTWPKMEPEPGKYNWEETDRLVEEALERGEAILWCLCFTPGWVSSIPDRETVLADERLRSWYGDGLAALYDSGQLAWQYPPADLGAWARYVEAVVRRYGDRVKHWEIWNEANSGHFIGTPQQYVDVLKVGYETIKRVDPQAVVVGIAGCPIWLHFTEEVLKLGGLEYMDVLAFHNYAYAPPEAYRCDALVADTVRLMEKYGRPLPMWDTEVGFPIPPRVAGRPMTWEQFQENLRRRAEGQPAHPFFARCEITRREPEMDCTYGAIWPTTEDRAARYLVRQFVMEMAEGVERFFVHAGAPVSRGKAPLLPGIAHAMMARALGTATFRQRLMVPSDTARIYVFGSDNGPVAVCWTTRAAERISITTAANRLVIADLYGNRSQVGGERGEITLALTNSPQYILGWPEDARITRADAL